MTWGQIVLGLAVIAFLFILIKLIAGPSIDDLTASPACRSPRKFGIFVGLIASAGMVVGAYMSIKESGELPGSLGGSKGGATPPTA